MVNPFDIYLAPELSKFIGNINWVEKFIQENNNDDLIYCNLPNNKRDFLMKFNSKVSIEEFILNLSEENKKNLSRLLSNWRNNGVYNKINHLEMVGEKYQHSFWTILDIPLTYLYISPAERSLWDLFERHQFSLIKIANDPKLLRYSPYNGYLKNINEIEYPICLGEQQGFDLKYKIFDGVHRAIQIAINNEESLKLCYLESNTKVNLAV